MPQDLVGVGVAHQGEDLELVAVELLDAGAAVGDDLAYLGQDQVEDLPQVERAVEGVGRRTQGLGLLTSIPFGLQETAFSIAMAAWVANAVASSASSSV